MTYVTYYLCDSMVMPFVDETGITENVDFSIAADMTDLADIKKQLNKMGLDFVKGTKKMKVIVISDPK